MSIYTKVVEYRRLRDGSAWKLLASDSAPTVLAILGEHFGEGEIIPASTLRELVRRDLEDLSTQGLDKGADPGASNAANQIARWLSLGYLERRFLPGEKEEHYELSIAAVSAIRLAGNIAKPRIAATESRLATVVSLVLKLEEETDPNPESRIATLEGERARIEARIEELRANSLRALDDARAAERAAEIVSLAEELVGDFIRVGSEFERLNRDLRHSLVEGEANRGKVLDEVFSSVDMIAESEAGRAFNGFYRLLMDANRRELFEAAVDEILRRNFASKLPEEELTFLTAFTDLLLDRGSRVHETQIRLARSLRDFVRSREYLEKRRLTALLDQAMKGAITLKNDLRPQARLELGLDRTNSETRSIGQWLLYDPASAWKPSDMSAADKSDISPEEIAHALLEAEIDYRILKEHILQTLISNAQPSIAEILETWHPEQGLGSIVGLIDLGFKYGLQCEGTEEISWTNKAGDSMKASIPLIRFSEESIHDFD